MTNEQKAHSAHLAKAFQDTMEVKYSNGAKEHGGNLWDRSPMFLLNQAISEAVDQFVYLQTLKDKLTDIPEMHNGEPEDPIKPFTPDDYQLGVTEGLNKYLKDQQDIGAL